ncbi:phage replisome organizer N-terminal domain-containing protein [Streptococcus pseudopneumoniae]|uniref:phage replisome organizer N-terminal domain-containing protein n=1 Tax=Streptococcus pseudopneumoniae TaxID=257758 RepID=UPI00066D97D3|nr:phage replisome organizer N-terminal domain-containing protein [Streptococcus pseudopneumoniae]
MSEIKWIKITTDIFDDEKMCLIDALPDRDAIIVIWIKLITLAGKLNTKGVLAISKNIVYTDEMLAQTFHRPLNTVRMALEVFEKFGMVEKNDGVIMLPNWEKHQNIDGMEKIKEQNRNRAARHRQKQKLLAQNNESNVTDNVMDNVMDNVTVTHGNALDKELDKDIEINNNKVMISSSLSENLKNSGIHLTDKSHQQLLDYVGLDGMSFDMLNRAVEKTSGSHKPSFNYLIAILESWKKKGFTSIEQVDEDDRKYKEGKNFNRPGQQNDKTLEQEAKDEWGY